MEIDFGVVPIENNLTGLISQTMHCFINFPVYTLGSFKIPINHFLLSYGKDIAKIKTIRSHPQAFDQCKMWLEKNLPHTIKEKTQSTISAISESSSKDVAFNGSLEATELFKLNVLAKNIENVKNNFTRFFVISRGISKDIINKLKMKREITLLLVSVYDRVGVLRDILNVFADRNVNLASLQSIPAYFHPWDYLFFLEIEKSYFSRDLKIILKNLGRYCPFIKTIGVS
jgi:chorismate mutase/prephenate dehydratase